MPSRYSNNPEFVSMLMRQIHDAIGDILTWNREISGIDDYLQTTEGARTLAATCMLLEAIGEGVKRVDKVTEGKLLCLRPEIPWTQIKGMRDHIAHGYFDIDAEVIWNVVQEDLPPLQRAIEYLASI